MNFQKRPISKNKKTPAREIKKDPQEVSEQTRESPVSDREVPSPVIMTRKPVRKVVSTPESMPGNISQSLTDTQLQKTDSEPSSIDPSSASENPPSSHLKAKISVIILGLFIVGLLGWGAVKLVKSIDLTSIIFSAGKNLRTDENGHTNILLTGIGGKGHDGGNLTDTIIVANIDYENKAISMLSIPRDLYVKDKRFVNGGRINTVFAIGKNNGTTTQGMENLKQIVSNITGVQIQYWAKVDFKAFTEIIDSIGGVDVILEKPIYDTAYPTDERGNVGTFAMSVGPHKLDGKTALKFARSRHGDGDFARALRQQQLMGAIKEKALSLNVLTDPTKIAAVYNSLSSNIETDFDLKEMIELAHIAKDFGKESITSRVLTDHDTNCGGFLYQPPRDLYEGASVFLPTGNNYNTIHFFVKSFFGNPLLAKDQSPIQILNGTKRPVAGKLTNVFNRFCLNVIYYGNAENRALPESTLYYKPGPNGEKPPLLNFIQLLIPPMKIQAGIPTVYLDDEEKQFTSFVIELGADFTESKPNDSNVQSSNTQSRAM